MDHGEIWQIPWFVLNSNEQLIEMEVIAPSSGLNLARSITLGENRPEFIVSYSLTNSGSEPLSFMWTCHPLFTLFPDSEILINGVKNWIQVDPLPLETSSLPNEPFLGVGRGQGAKWWNARDERFESITLRNQRHGDLVISASPEVQHVGIWVDNQIYSSSPSIAIEPAIGWFDDLNLAIENGTSGRVEPKIPQTWSLFFSLR